MAYFGHHFDVGCTILLSADRDRHVNTYVETCRLSMFFLLLMVWSTCYSLGRMKKSVSGIKGYRTVIFRFGSQLLPVREVAFMPNNPQSTFTSSHLQRVNSFLPGIHSLHSSVKVIDRNGIFTKFIPTKRNGLDYITISLVVPKDDPTQQTRFA